MSLTLGNLGAATEHFGSVGTLLAPLRNPDFVPPMLARADASFLKSILTHEFSFLRQGQSILTYLHARSLCSFPSID
jgi:alanine dehydrogenase